MLFSVIITYIHLTFLRQILGSALVEFVRFNILLINVNPNVMTNLKPYLRHGDNMVIISPTVTDDVTYDALNKTSTNTSQVWYYYGG